MKLLPTSLLAGFAAAALGSSVAAQISPNELALDALSGATLDRPRSLPGLQLEAGTEGAEVSVKGTYALRAVGAPLLGITATAPFDKDKGKDGFALDALTADAALNFEITWSGLSGVQLPSPAKVAAFCARHQIPSTDCGKVPASRDAAVIEEWQRLGWAPGAAVWSVGPFAKVGHAEFKFVDATAVAEKSETETPWSLGASASWIDLWARRMWTAKFEHQRTYKDADERTICPAVPAGPSVLCLTGPLGSPVRDDKDILSGEVRQRFKKHYGAALTASYDFSNRKFGAQLPIYFIAGAGYTGGVRLGYEWAGDDEPGNDEDEAKVGVFVSKALTLH